MELSPELTPATLVKLVSFLFWSGSYLYCTVTSPDKSPEWSSRAVTLLHGSVASAVGLAQCGVFTLSKCRLTMKVTLSQYALMAWSWGYFAFDLLWCLMYWTNSTVMLCHHASALIGINIYMDKEYTGCTFACTLALLEVTNPLLQMRCLKSVAAGTHWTHEDTILALWSSNAFMTDFDDREVYFEFLRNEGYDKTIIFYIVEVLYLVSFLLLRGVLGTYLIVKILNSDILDLDEKIISFVFYAVSVSFIYEIVGYVLYKYRNKLEEFTGFANEMGVILNEQQ